MGPGRDPTQVLRRGRDAVRVVRGAERALCVEEARLGLVEPSLVGEHLPDVAGDERGHDRVAGAEAGVPTPLVELDGVVPTAFEVREPAEVLEHARLTVEVVELLVDLERAGRVGRELGFTELDVGPVQDEAGVGLGREVAGCDCRVDRLVSTRRLPLASGPGPGAPRRTRP